MPNAKTIISGHNKKLLRKSVAQNGEENKKFCNCRVPANCPLQNKCLTDSIVYCATVETGNQSPQEYVGLTAQPFKSRFGGHTYDLKHPNNEGTGLSQHVWNLRDKGQQPKVTWRILDKCTPYKPGSNSCNLCLTEKYRILKADPKVSLNKRSELVSKCRHSNKWKLEAVT